jgi:predicted phage terminase large subunit-like protein
VLFGGAAGPGKSSALLMAALQYVDEPSYAAILFRRTYQDLALPGALMDRAHEWLDGQEGLHWNDTTKTWTFPSGATLSFGYLATEVDKYRYQSAEFQFIGFDELTQFEETQYRYLFSRLRRLEGSSIPLRMRAASNPGGLGHDWVKARFLDSNEPDRLFLPARLQDNPYIDQASYIESLNHLDPVTREHLLEGNWEITESGGMFERQWFEVVDSVPVNECIWVRYWDLAATPDKPQTDPDWTVGGLVGLNQGTWYVVDVKRIRANPGDVQALVRQTAILDGQNISIRMEQEPGSSGVNTIYHYHNSVLVGFDFDGIPSTGSKVERARPVSSAAHAHNIKLVRGSWVVPFLDEFHAFPLVAHDDQVDMLSGAFRVLTAPQVSMMEYYQPVEISRY